MEGMVDMNDEERRLKGRYYSLKLRYRRQGFHLTYDEWSSWWEEQLGPDWHKLRGPKAGQYSMERIDKTKAFQLGNIKCVQKRTIKRY
jgi:hypothetical protein